MKTFRQWLEAAPVGYRPPPSLIGFDPLESALQKIANNEEAMPFNSGGSNFVDAGVLTLVLGLNREERAALTQAGLIVKDEGGVSIDEGKFRQLLATMSK